MSPQHPLSAPPFLDPRLKPDFISSLYPLANGQLAPPPETEDPHERRCLAFLAAYYTVNIAEYRLLQSGTPDNEERLQLQTALSSLESLEDHFAPIGFYGDPQMNGSYYADIHFCRPELPALRPPPNRKTIHVAIPGLEFLPESELQGPMTTTRWSYEEKTHP